MPASTCAGRRDIGLRNLDLVLGLEKRIVFDIVEVVEGRCQLRQALIKDKRFGESLSILPAAQNARQNRRDGKPICQGDRRSGRDVRLRDHRLPGRHRARAFAMPSPVRAKQSSSPRPKSARFADADRVIGKLNETRLADCG